MRSFALWLNTLTAAAAAAGLTFVAATALLVVSGVLQSEQALIYAWFPFLEEQTQSLQGGDKILVMAICLMAALLGAVITLTELRLLLPPGRTTLLISNDDLGRTTIERASVEAYLALSVKPIAGIESANVRARSRREGELKIRARLNLSPNADTVIPSIVEDARATMTRAATKQIGFEVTDLVVTTAMRPTRSDRRRGRLQLT